MKKILVIVLILFLGNAYLSIRNAIWADAIAAEYMIGLQKQIVCNQSVIIENRIPILERVLKLPWAPPVGVEDDSKCEEAETQWKKFEENRKLYKSGRYFPLLKEMLKKEFSKK